MPFPLFLLSTILTCCYTVGLLLQTETNAKILFKDGINADRNATDYKKDFFVTEDITKIHKLHLAPGGGFAMKIEGYLP